MKLISFKIWKLHRLVNLSKKLQRYSRSSSLHPLYLLFAKSEHSVFKFSLGSWFSLNILVFIVKMLFLPFILLLPDLLKVKLHIAQIALIRAIKHLILPPVIHLLFELLDPFLPDPFQHFYRHFLLFPTKIKSFPFQFPLIFLRGLLIIYWKLQEIPGFTHFSDLENRVSKEIFRLFWLFLRFFAIFWKWHFCSIF